MKNQNILLFFIILLIGVIFWQYNQIQTIQTDFLNLQICIIEGIL
nr:MAG TPA: Protein of unknown function (DUF3139) [Caudoviricetes sp.]